MHRLKFDVFDEDEAVEDENLNLRIGDENHPCFNALMSCHAMPCERIMTNESNEKE